METSPAGSCTLNSPDLKEPAFSDVLDARDRISPWLSPTALRSYPRLSNLSGIDLLVKQENHQPIGAFKVRGGVNLLSCLDEEDRQRGVISASTGNHGQSIAWAAKLFGVRAIITVPEGANPAKVDSMRALGAEVVFHGKDFDEAREYCEQYYQQKGLRYVHSANEPMLIAGVGTCALEIFNKLPEPDYLFVPIGLGSGACGACLVASTLNPSTKIIGVQATGAPAMTYSWREGRMISTPKADTSAEGLATRVPAEMTLEILRQHLTDIVLVDDKEIRNAVYLILNETHNMVEGAGAASTAAALKMKDELHGKTVVSIISGGNLELRELQCLLKQRLNNIS